MMHFPSNTLAISCCNIFNSRADGDRLLASKLYFGGLEEIGLIYNRMKSDICKDGKSEMPGSIILIILQMHPHSRLAS